MKDKMERRISMKRLYSILTGMGAIFVFASLALADPGTTWEKKIDGPERFRVLSQFGGAAVLDKETGRVWEQSPSTVSGAWFGAHQFCYQKEVGGRKGWRLPTIEELASLVDTSQVNPSLPLGHPFSNVQLSNAYWSATSNVEFPENAHVVFFNDGGVSHGQKINTAPFDWCVRGGQGIDGVQ
jgi:hypothetical protein